MEPFKTRGRRECRVFFAPVAPRAKIESTQISSLQVRRTFRHSLRDGFNGFLRARPGDRAFLSPSPRDAKHHRELISASGYQAHTTSPSALHAFVLRVKASIAFRSQRFVTIAKRPSWRARNGPAFRNDLPDAASEKAATRWHDGQITLIVGKLVKEFVVGQRSQIPSPGSANATRIRFVRPATA